LVLDEATSALDNETENLISTLFKTLEGKVTLIVIAHRYSTIRHSPKIIYLENGQILSTGSFDELRSINADFDNQAKLSGY
jgi:ABC-type bacteriocin/lantibiotic exporter with double-glycine peptidase domain